MKGAGLAVALCLVAGICSAQPEPQNPALAQAQAAFETLVKEAKARGDLPRLSDPQAGPLLRRIWAAALPGDNGQRVSGADVLTASEVSTAEFKLFETYLYFEPPSPKEIDFDRLVKRFGSEFAGSLTASISAAARLSTTFERYRVDHPDPDPAHHAAMIRLLRSPGLGLVTNGQKLMLNPAARPDDVAGVAAAFASNGAGLASIYSKDERAMIGEAFRRLGPKLAAGPRQDIERAAKAFAETPCGPSCAIPP